MAGRPSGSGGGPSPRKPSLGQRAIEHAAQPARPRARASSPIRLWCSPGSTGQVEQLTGLGRQVADQLVGPQDHHLLRPISAKTGPRDGGAPVSSHGDRSRPRMQPPSARCPADPAASAPYRKVRPAPSPAAATAGWHSQPAGAKSRVVERPGSAPAVGGSGRSRARTGASSRGTCTCSWYSVVP